MSTGAKKRLIVNQLLIFSVTGYLYFFGKADPMRAGIIFVLMQLGALLGNWWGHRLQKQMIADREKLPIKPL